MLSWAALLNFNYWILYICLDTVQNGDTQDGVYGWLWFGQCSVVSFVIKKLVHLFMVKLYIFSYTDVLNLNIFSPLTIWE